MGCKPFHDGLRYVQFGHNYLYLYVISPFPRAIHGTPITTFICAETHCSVSLSGLVHGCGQCIAGVARRDLEPALCFDCLESTGDSVTMGLCLLVLFTGRLVALRESSSPSTSVRHVGRRSSPYSYSVFLLHVRLDASGHSLLGPSLFLPLVHSVVPSLPPFRQFHAANYLQTR